MNPYNEGAQQQLLEWSLRIRGPECLVVEDDTELPTNLTIWSKEPLDVPDAVYVRHVGKATGTAPAVRNRGVAGWYKYELQLPMAVLN